MKKINLHPELKHKIAEEFEVTMQTVDMSLKYVFNSEKAKLIRDRAKELLKEEIQKIENDEETT
ncbi:MAG: hypothetical protein LC112_07605 [Flavobacteriales bacterium]|nr:hypothetical protein [Flavobacteriales bacterium]